MSSDSGLAVKDEKKPGRERVTVSFFSQKPFHTSLIAAK